MTLSIFLQFFGIPYILRYLENKVLVVVDKKETKGIPAPAITFCGIHPKTKAWKKATSLTTALNTCNSSDNLFDCMESQAWSLEDVVLDAVKGVTVKENLMNASLWSSQFLKKKACFTMNLNKKIGTNFKVDGIDFSLNKTMLYTLYIHSQTYFLENSNPLTLPIIQLEVQPSVVTCNTYLSLAMVEHHEL